MLTFDITNDFIVGDRITKETLNKYSKLPHKIKAGLFLLCVEGSVQASINLAKYTINKYDFVTMKYRTTLVSISPDSLRSL